VSALDFLLELHRRNIHVWDEAGRLRCSAPAGALTPELRDQLQAHKGDILDFLRTKALDKQQRALVPLQPRGERIPVLGVPGHNGDVLCYRQVSRYLGEDQPLYGLQPPGVDGEAEPLREIEAMAGHFLPQVRAFRPEGPVIIAGYCAGGATALELAQRLVEQGTAVPFVALFGCPWPHAFRPARRAWQRWRTRMHNLGTDLRSLASAAGMDERRAYLERRLELRRERLEALEHRRSQPEYAKSARIEQATLDAVCRTRPRRFEGQLALFLPSREWLDSGSEALRWCEMARETAVYFGPEGCTNEEMMQEPAAATFAALFRHQMERAS
jgi:thioesterase domain-containing protein